ncbi:NAD(P)-dependent oxidoreductase [Streptomyces sp. NPDC013178]|uniref:NAD(P)-dependent oxidoreductase n=1 Tax=Streptomyces sp. NPDC013178 TaxID=3155118 RepID=UPI0033F1C99F
MTATDEARRPVVGFIGLGDQGAPMAQAIGQNGFDLRVWARRPRSLQALDGTPHAVAASPAELAGSVDVLALCLRDDDDIWDILRTDGLLSALNPGTVVVNHGTGDPDENTRIAAFLAQRGVAFLDAPVSGGRPGAMARTLTTMVGGDADAFTRCEAVFATFSRRVALMGPSGSGQLTKLLNNAMTMSNLQNAVDLVRTADQLGADVLSVIDVINDSSGGSAVLRALASVITPADAVHLSGLMRKDIEHFAEGVRARGVDAGPWRDRGLAGAQGLVDAAALLAEHRRDSATRGTGLTGTATDPAR